MPSTWTHVILGFAILHVKRMAIRNNPDAAPQQFGARPDRVSMLHSCVRCIVEA